VELAIDCLAVLVGELERVRAVAVHVTVSIGSTAVGEEEHHLMNRLRAMAPEIKHRICILEMRLRITLLRVNEVRKVDRIANEEDRRVVAYLNRLVCIC